MSKASSATIFLVIGVSLSANAYAPSDLGDTGQNKSQQQMLLDGGSVGTDNTAQASGPAPTSTTAPTPTINNNPKTLEDVQPTLGRATLDEPIISTMPDESTQVDKIDEPTQEQNENKKNFLQRLVHYFVDVLGLNADKIETEGEKIIADNAAIVDKTQAATQESENKVYTLLTQATIKYNLKEKLVNFNGFNLQATYQTTEEPGYIGGKQYREDDYIMSPTLNLPALIWPHTALQFQAQSAIQLSLYHYFDGFWSAINPVKPYWPNKFPFNAERADKKLQPGDMAQFRSSLLLSGGVDHVFPTPVHTQVSADAIYKKNGDLEIYIFKALNHKVRIRMASRTDIGPYGDFRFSIFDGFSLFGHKILSNPIVHLFGLDDLYYKLWGRDRQSVFLGDYTLDLSDAPNGPVSKLYNDLVKSMIMAQGDKESASGLGLLNPFRNTDKLGQILWKILRPIDDLYHVYAQSESDPDKRLVQRNFEGSNTATPAAGGGKFNNRQTNWGPRRAYRQESNVVWRDNRLSRFVTAADGKDDTLEYYYVPTWTSHQRLDWALGFRGHDITNSRDVLYEADSKYKPTRFHSMLFSLDYTNKKYNDKIHQDILKQMRLEIPAPVYTLLQQKLADLNLLKLAKPMKNVRVSSRYFVNRQGYDFVEQTYKEGFAKSKPEDATSPQSDFRARLVAMMLATPKLQSEASSQKSCPEAYKTQETTIRHYCADIEYIVGKLSSVVNGDEKPAERNAALTALFTNPLFNEIGNAYLLQLIPPSHLSEATFFEIKFYLPGADQPVGFSFGQTPDRALFETILDIQNIMNDQMPDMRLDGDTDTLTTRKTRGVGDLW